MRYLDFEQPLSEIESRIEEIKKNTNLPALKADKELERLTAKYEKTLHDIYKNLTPWQKCGVARYESRPHTLDYIKNFVTEFLPLSGDRTFGEDRAIIGGFGKIGDRTVMIIGQEKGHDTDTHLYHNFGMPKPEGYRKAIRLMKLAEQFGTPVVTLVDTSGAFPGLEGEERGQAHAIASCTDACLNLKVPIVSVVIGEGGSGGAIALASGNSVLMLSNSIYSVISPEGCASILWKDFKFAPKAAEILHLTAQDLLEFGVIDEIIDEPMGGAHRFPDETMQNVKKAIEKHIKKFDRMTPFDILADRQDKFTAMTRLK